MQQIGRGVYAETGYRGCNVGFVVTSEGVILINTPMVPSEARRWRDEIARTTDREIIYIINTDYHPECTVGNHVFGAPVIAHELAWEKVDSYGSSFRRRLVGAFEGEPEIAAELERVRIVIPRVTFTDEMTLYKGDTVLELVHVGAHTPASIMVYVPKESVLFAGDVVVNGVHPVMEEANSKEWLNALTYIRRPWVKADIIVPGEGEICGKEATQKLSQYIRRLRAKVRGAYSTGHRRSATVALAVERMIDFFPMADDEEKEARQRLKANAGQVYKEIQAGQEE
jgi:cyclase